MMRRLILPLIFGLVGCAILIGLGLWQLARLERKEAYLAEIERMIWAAPVALPAAPDAATDRFLPVRAEGVLTGDEIDVLTSIKDVGPGYRVISVLETPEGRRLLVDRGFIPVEARDQPRPAAEVLLTGNLHWPQEVDGFTPAPDAKTGIWFARDLPAMAAALKTEPLLIVARSDTGDGVQPLPVGTEGIANDHLNYAITWFSLAAVWAGMTLLLLWRIRQRNLSEGH